MTAPAVFAQGVTTATIRGSVVDDDGEPLPGANVVAVHQPSGSQYGTTSNADGNYVLPNIRVGGPYRVTASFVGYQTRQETGIRLDLGERRTVDFELPTATQALDEVQVIAEQGVFSRERTGVGTDLDESAVENTPSVGRELADLARLTPQAYVVNSDDDGSAISISGQPNRYNSIFIDGAVSNDVFGLSAQGTDGGQTGATPIPLDAIEAMEIAVSPFDVTQSGFAGGAINAVTRSGTNTFTGSAYFLRRDETLVQNLPEFSNNRYGFRLGGPIVQDKLFFFVNAELLRTENPQPFAGSYAGNTPLDDPGTDAIDSVSELAGLLQNELGYNPGAFGDKTSTLDSENIVARLDYNLNPNHRLTARYIFNSPENTDQFRSDSRTIEFANNAEVFPNTTNNATLEWNGTFGNQVANKLILGYKRVKDDRGFRQQPFPFVSIDDGDGDIEIGSEQFSTANLLEQDAFTLTNNTSIFVGDHTFTVGTHNEFYRLSNLFIPRNFGSYEYASLDDFVQSVRAINDPSIDPVAPTEFQRGFSLQDDDPSTPGFEEVVGDGTNAIGEFDAYILGFYVQDEWQATDQLRLTAGLRLDIPQIASTPNAAPDALTQTVPDIQEFYALNGARPGQAPDAQYHLSPRLGFNWDVFGNRSTQVRGGLGVFTSRQPFVWYGGMFLNNGTNTGFAFQSDNDGVLLDNGEPAPFIPVVGPDGEQNDLLDVTELEGRAIDSVVPSGRLEMFEQDYSLPRLMRYSLGVDQRLPLGFVGTIEGQYSNYLSNLLVTNVNIKPANATLSGPDNRPIWDYEERDIDPRYSDIHRVGNTNRGYSYDITARLQNEIADFAGSNQLAFSASYTYGDSWVIQQETSSQINSIWEGTEHVNGANSLDLTRSDFALGHRILGQLTYRQEYLDNFATTLALTYTGQSGRPFSYVIDESDDMIGEGGDPVGLFYIPRSTASLMYGQVNDDGDLELLTGDDAQAAASQLDRIIRGTEYLSRNRGTYAERNGDRTPFESVVDLKIAQDIFGELLGQGQRIQISLDIFNFTSLLGELFDTDWGTRYFVPDSNVEPVQFLGFADEAINTEDLFSDGAPAYTPVYRTQLNDFTEETDLFDELETGSTYSSQWQMQLGLRYTF
jgi:hypothetical protein